MTYETILFDVGDTLVRVPKPAAVYHQILAQHGCPLSLQRMDEMLAETRRIVEQSIPLLIGEDLSLDRRAAADRRALHVDTIISLASPPEPMGVRQAFFDLYVGTEFFTLYPDVVATLQRLREDGYRLGVVSNWEGRLRQLFAAHGIDEYFDFVVVSELEGYVKPHPALYRRALELAGTAAHRTLHVGDKLREDVQGAAQVGIRTVLIDRTGGPPADYEPRICSLSELPPLLDIPSPLEGRGRG